LQEKLLAEVLSRDGADEKLERLAREIAEKRNNPYTAVEEILS
jgi:hypothetical protein